MIGMKDRRLSSSANHNITQFELDNTIIVLITMVAEAVIKNGVFKIIKM